MHAVSKPVQKSRIHRAVLAVLVSASSVFGQAPATTPATTPATQPAATYPALQKRLGTLEQENKGLKDEVAALEAAKADLEQQLAAAIADKRVKTTNYGKEPKVGMSETEMMACYDPKRFDFVTVNETVSLKEIKVINASYEPDDAKVIRRYISIDKRTGRVTAISR